MKNTEIEIMLSEAGAKLTAAHKMLDDLFTVAFDKDLDPQHPSHQQRIHRLWPVVAEMVNAAFCDLDDYIRIIKEVEFESKTESESNNEVSV